MTILAWPAELPVADAEDMPRLQSTFNISLDFHGDPLRARLVIFSDGNHHMALEESIQLFLDRYPSCEHIFYATTPPGPILDLLRTGRLGMGNLVLSIQPHVFLSPRHVIDTLAEENWIGYRMPFMQNRGNALLVRRGNPKNISPDTLAAPGTRLFLSNPDSEKVSYQGYREALLALAAARGIGPDFLQQKAENNEIIYGTAIHHREAPQAVADGRADVAILYYHLALHFCRIFPDLFELIPLNDNRINSIHLGLIRDGGPWGRYFFRFLASDAVTAIYNRHGLDRPPEETC